METEVAKRGVVRRYWWFFAVCAAGLVGAGAIVGFTLWSNAHATREVRLVMTLNDGKSARAGCEGTGGYNDIAMGGAVTVQDGSGTIIATNTLGPGTANGDSCVFRAFLPGVPLADFYQVSVGHRNPVRFSRAEMEANGWTVDTSLG